VLDTLDNSTAFAGIGYSVNHQGDRHDIVLGCSHIYNSRGQGLKYRLAKVEDQLFWDRHHKPHLSYNDAYKFGVSIIEMFYRTMDEFPRRVVVHKRTFFTKEEISGLKDSLLAGGIKEVDLIEINYEDNFRYVAARSGINGQLDVDNYALPRGTCVQLDRYEALLWTHGVVPSVENAAFKFYLGGRYIPGPLRIRKHFGNGGLGMIATEILGLTKVNWNSFDLYSQLPATIKSSNEIARIGTLLSKKEGVTYDYRLFI
jgi:argonaute-like protein implicated in RNA metabolism and viral defense